MKTFEIALIAVASVIAALIVLCSYLCQRSWKKKQTSEEPNATSLVQRVYRDVEKGQIAKTRTTKDGEMVVYAGAGAAMATAAVVAGTSGCGGGCGGGGCGC
jgi:hypothetical protein